MDNSAAVKQAEHAGKTKETELPKRGGEQPPRVSARRLNQGALHPHMRPRGRLLHQVPSPHVNHPPQFVLYAASSILSVSNTKPRSTHRARAQRLVAPRP
eukprot:5433391-Pleurochrysis_carterae.AAC.4